MKNLPVAVMAGTVGVALGFALAFLVLDRSPETAALSHGAAGLPTPEAAPPSPPALPVAALRDSDDVPAPEPASPEPEETPREADVTADSRTLDNRLNQGEFDHGYEIEQAVRSLLAGSFDPSLLFAYLNRVLHEGHMIEGSSEKKGWWIEYPSPAARNELAFVHAGFSARQKSTASLFTRFPEEWLSYPEQLGGFGDSMQVNIIVSRDDQGVMSGSVSLYCNSVSDAARRAEEVGALGVPFLFVGSECWLKDEDPWKRPMPAGALRDAASIFERIQALTSGSGE